jgi:hypothetical protein
VVNGQSISVSPQTQYVNGSASDLAAGKLVKVDVVLVGNVPVATKIEFVQLHEASYLEGDVTAKSASTLELLGPGGAIIEFSSTTQFQDKSNAKLNVLTFANLNVGDHLQVKGNQVDFATLLADKVIRTQPSTAIVLEGRALNVAAPSFTVVDIEVATNAATDFRDATGTPVSADVFFSKVAGQDVIVSAVRSTTGGLLAISARID